MNMREDMNMRRYEHFFEMNEMKVFTSHVIEMKLLSRVCNYQSETVSSRERKKAVERAIQVT